MQRGHGANRLEPSGQVSLLHQLYVAGPSQSVITQHYANSGSLPTSVGALDASGDAVDLALVYKSLVRHSSGEHSLIEVVRESIRHFTKRPFQLSWNTSTGLNSPWAPLDLIFSGYCISLLEHLNCPQMSACSSTYRFLLSACTNSLFRSYFAILSSRISQGEHRIISIRH